MKRIILLAFIVFISSTNYVFANGNTPVLEEGIIDITVGGNIQEVKQEITLSNIGGFENGLIEHILLNIGTINELSITSDNQELLFEVVEEGTLNKVILEIPEESIDKLHYVISFSYSSNETRIPLILPPVSTDGNSNNILLKVSIPEGQYIQESFPIIDKVNTGSIEEYMMNMPSFVKLDLSSKSFNLFTNTNIYTLFGLVIILGVILGWVVQLLKSNKTRGGSVNV